MLDEGILVYSVAPHRGTDVGTSGKELVSREHIAREFKPQTGQTVHRYIVKAPDRCCTPH